ncbi:hypothetical protein COK08_24835 [Bacillus cereus]|uniref:YopX family protein n=1 Tax=Bacillus cereus TaxID=1396 RepID=UPI000BEBA1E2|nr:YopX family protein [Bacillus cereus]PDY73605.1 hypothetical protein CON10_27105 [Bacillus cereus]PEE11742.1 hypothetical protein CON52_12490 [Bacillus cereus]PFP85842.1 hypothetical protein COK08_24835 [Bacillus cereus]
MREIEFRGRKINSTDWVCGDLRKTQNGNIGISVNGRLYIVDAETIGQYIGLKGKENKKIFEGDIVKAWSTGSCGTFEVRWRQGGAPCFMLYPAFKNGERWRLHGTQDKLGDYYDDVEVIGNIHENPELLKN